MESVPLTIAVKSREESEVSWSLLMFHSSEDKKIAQLAFSELLTM